MKANKNSVPISKIPTPLDSPVRELSKYGVKFDLEVTDQARIQDFCQGRAPREWWPYMGWEWAIFYIRKHRFATFQDVYCHIMPEWCWTAIQETPVSLLSALETREPAPSARVLPSQGWAPAPAPPGSAPADDVTVQVIIIMLDFSGLVTSASKLSMLAQTEPMNRHG